MKKYLFLLFLLLIYFILLLFPKTNNVLSYDDNGEKGVISVVINYDNGINSNDLKTFFDKYNKEYYVLKMEVNSDELLVSCSDFSSCISDVYKINDNDFEINYISTGFRINKVYFIAYKEEIEPYLNSKNVIYETW